MGASICFSLSSCYYRLPFHVLCITQLYLRSIGRKERNGWIQGTRRRMESELSYEGPGTGAYNGEYIRIGYDL